MPTLYPFTPEGVKQKLDDLYALSDNDLKIQADLIKADLPLWMSNNFYLTADQLTYLDNLENRAIIYLQDQCSFNIENRLPIFLVQESSSSSDQFKWVHTENTNGIMANDNGDFTATGSLSLR